MSAEPKYDLHQGETWTITLSEGGWSIIKIEIPRSAFERRLQLVGGDVAVFRVEVVPRVQFWPPGEFKLMTEDAGLTSD